MPISENHLKKLVELFQNEDISFTMDAISIIESLIYTEEDFRELLEKIGKKKISAIPTIEEIIRFPGFAFGVDILFSFVLEYHMSIWLVTYCDCTFDIVSSKLVRLMIFAEYPSPSEV